MGFFSELDIELEPKKEYLRGRRHPIEREMTLEEMLEEQILLGEYDMQKKITAEEEFAILTDSFSSPYWKTGINKLIPGTLPSPYQYAKKRN